MNALTSVYCILLLVQRCHLRMNKCATCEYEHTGCMQVIYGGLYLSPVVVCHTFFALCGCHPDQERCFHCQHLDQTHDLGESLIYFAKSIDVLTSHFFCVAQTTFCRETCSFSRNTADGNQSCFLSLSESAQANEYLIMQFNLDSKTAMSTDLIGSGFDLYRSPQPRHRVFTSQNTTAGI